MGSSPTGTTRLNDLVAEWVKQLPFKEWIVGSSPTGVTKIGVLKYMGGLHAVLDKSDIVLTDTVLNQSKKTGT